MVAFPNEFANNAVSGSNLEPAYRGCRPICDARYSYLPTAKPPFRWSHQRLTGNCGITTPTGTVVRSSRKAPRKRTVVSCTA